MRSFLVALALSFSTVAWAKPDDDLVAACKAGDLAKVDAALDKGASPDATDKDGRAALEKAVFWPEITKRLLEKGAAPDGGAYPALTSAGNVYAVDTMRLLLDAGADPNKAVTVKQGRVSFEATPLRQVVAQTNCVPCLTLLLERGADPKANEEMGGNLLHVFAAYGNSQVARRDLYAQSASIVEKRFKTKVPDWYRNVDLAGNGAPAAMLAPLVAAGLDLEARNTVGNTPLLDVLGGGVGNKSEVAVALVEAGAKLDVEHPQFGKAIHIATRTRMVDVVKAMIGKGADPNVTGRDYDDNAGQFVDGFTPLVIAAMQDDLPMVELLLANGAGTAGGLHGASYNLKTGCHTSVKGKGAIYFAIENGNAAMVEKLAAVGPWGELDIDQLKQKKSSTQQLGTTAVTTTTTTCIEDGTFTPGAYAAALGSPLAKTLSARGL